MLLYTCHFLTIILLPVGPVTASDYHTGRLPRWLELGLTQYIITRHGYVCTAHPNVMNLVTRPTILLPLKLHLTHESKLSLLE